LIFIRTQINALTAGKIIIFFLQDMFYKTFIQKKLFPLVYLFLNYIIPSLNF